jgi:hypothetical protein
MIPFHTFKPDIRCSRPSTMGRKLAALSLAAAVLAVAGCSTHSARTPTPSLSIPAGQTSSTPPAPSSPPSSTPATQPASFKLGYQPLYPFASLVDAQAWQAADRSGGHQPWHADAGATAIAFSSGWLGFNEIDTVTSTRTGADGAHIGVGYRDPNGRLRTAALLHLVRFGTDPDSPWEVVGSDDPASFSLDTPAYGSPVTSPITVGGHIVGVDENIKVTVHRLASQAPVGTHCCTPAGMATPTGTDWAATVSFTAAPGDVLTIVAQTGGHLQAVERFAIQGVHT